MENNDLTKNNIDLSVVEEVLVSGNLTSLTMEGRMKYLDRVCDSLGLNKFTRPFDFITLNGKLTLYARKDCTEQLRRIYRISLSIESNEIKNGVYVVRARATMPDGRVDEATGAVPLPSNGGDAYANAIMKAETKAKRRVTLSIVGLGMLDESEFETIPKESFKNVSSREVIAAPEVLLNSNTVAPVLNLDLSSIGDKILACNGLDELEFLYKASITSCRQNGVSLEDQDILTAFKNTRKAELLKSNEKIKLN